MIFQTVFIIFLIIFLILAIGYYFFVRSSLSLWIRSIITGAKVSLFDIAYLRLQRLSDQEIRQIVESIISASKAGVNIKTNELASHFFAGGNIRQVIDAMIIAHKSKIPLTFDLASAIQLAGINLVEVVRMHVEPAILETPEISAIARDGIQLTAKCRVTMQSNIQNFIGGAGKETILARVGTGIVSAIGSATNHQDIVKDPSIISKHIMSIDRDKDNVSDIHQDTSFKVVSIDVASVRVGSNIAARLRTRWAEAQEKKAQAKAELERAEAISREKAAIIKQLEKEGDLIEAEVSVPLAIAEAIRSGKLSVKKYFEMKNLNADTEMRKAIASTVKPLQKKIS